MVVEAVDRDGSLYCAWFVGAELQRRKIDPATITVVRRVGDFNPISRWCSGVFHTGALGRAVS